MTLNDVRILLAFHYWARDLMLEAVESVSPEQQRKDLGSSFPSIHDTIVHMYAAEWIWHERWRGHSPTEPLRSDRFRDLGSVAEAWRTLERQMRTLLEDLGEPGLVETRSYNLLSGKPGVSASWQMFQHVVNHATYHRGQVMTMIRQIGGKPRSTDLITYYRERGAES